MFSDVFEDRKESPMEIGPNATSIDLLRAVYRNPSIPLPVRIRCAVAALPHETPRLAVTALVNEQSFAEILERRLKRMAKMERKPQTQTIAAEPPPLPRLADRRFRRV
jgi:hypothetical protein